MRKEDIEYAREQRYWWRKFPGQERSNDIKNLSELVSLGQEEGYLFLWNERVKMQIYDFMEGGKLPVFLLWKPVFLWGQR